MKNLKIKKITALLLTVIMVLSFAACGAASGQPGKNDVKKSISTEQGKYPVDFDFEKIYKDADAFYDDYELFYEQMEDFNQYWGRLDNAKTIREFLDKLSFGDAALTLDKLAYYADAGHLMFPGDPYFTALDSDLQDPYDIWDELLCDFEDEILALPYEKRAELFSDPLLAGYQYAYPGFIDPDEGPLPSDIEYEENEDYSYLYAGRMESLYDILAYTDFVGPEFTMPNGETKNLTKMDYEEIVFGTADRETKHACYNAWWKAVSQYANSFAYILESFMRETYAAALSDGYATAMESALDYAELPWDIIDRILAVAKKALPKAHEIYSFFGHGETDGDYMFFDVENYISPYEPELMEYDDAVDLAIEGLEPLGTDYVKHFVDQINSGSIDVYPKEGKAAGGFELAAYQTLPPIIEFNYTGTMREVLTIPHEMGHALYSVYTQENQPFEYINATTFTHEIASETNECIVLNTLINKAETDEEKLYWMEAWLKTFLDEFFRQLLGTEFEEYCYGLVEEGVPFNAADLATKHTELCNKYYGPEYTNGEYGGYYWAVHNHLYTDHYLFQYATSACYAVANAQRICSGDTAFRNQYIEFLKLGGSVSPEDAISVMGYDINSDEPFEAAMEIFGNMADEFIELYNEVCTK